MTFDPLARDDDALHLVRALPNARERGITVEALDVVLLRVAVGAVNAHRFRRILERRFRGEELRHAGFEIAAFAAVERLRRIEREQPCGARPRRHVRELQLDRLMIADRLAEGLATLGVARRERERALRDADPPRRDVDAAELEPARGLVEALAFPLADQIVRRDAIVLEDELGR